MPKGDDISKKVSGVEITHPKLVKELWDQSWGPYMQYFSGKPCPTHGEDNMSFSRMVSDRYGVKSIYQCLSPSCDYETERDPTAEQMQNYNKFMKTPTTV